MDEQALALRIRGVKKMYRLGLINGSTLQAELQSWWARTHGQEDPNQRIGADPARVGKRFWALNGIDFDIRRGERVGIIGVNGAGKSTLLKLICRITAPTEGEIDIWGRVSSMLEVGTGFHREMTGRENIYMNGAILGMSRAEIDACLEDIINFSELREFIDTPVKRYSSGMFVKLAFSVAAHLRSEIMIMDEVLAVGDMAFQQKCLARMRQAADEEGRTVLYVSHNMTTIRQLCERCIVLDHGRVIYDGETEHAIAAYLNLSLSENEVDMDLSVKSHIDRSDDSGISMTRLRLLDKITAVYDSGEDLRLLLNLNITRPAPPLHFRLTLRTETDLGLATAWSEALTLEGTGEKVVQLTLPLDSIAKGCFYGSIGVYRSDELGRMISLDHISRAFQFEVNGIPIWYTGAHGYMRLPQMQAWQEI